MTPVVFWTKPGELQQTLMASLLVIQGGNGHLVPTAKE
jgi:hypothetical protein